MGSGWAALGLVSEPVVVAAEEGEVVEVRFAAVGPVFDVVGVTPAWRSVAALPGAAAVAGGEGAALGWGDAAGAAADIQHF